MLKKYKFYVMFLCEPNYLKTRAENFRNTIARPQCNIIAFTQQLIIF